MTIDYDRVTITSPREGAYDYRGNWDNLNINAEPKCAPFKAGVRLKVNLKVEGTKLFARIETSPSFRYVG